MNRQIKSRGRRSQFILALAAGSLLGTGVLAEASVFTWTSATTGGNWSDPSNWTLDSGATSAPPVAGDTANLNDATANRTVFYDSASSGALGTLNLTQTDPFTNLLDANKSLAITNAVTLGASGGGTSQIFNDPTTSTTAAITLTTAFTGGLTVNAGGAYEVEAYQNTSGKSSQSTTTGNVTISGGTLLSDQSVSNSAGTGLATTFSNNLSMSSGTISIGLSGPAGNALIAKNGGGLVNTTINRLTVNGNLSLTGGSVLSSTTANNFWVEGSTATIDTLSTDLPVQLGLVVNGGSGTVSQILQSDTAITGGLLIRNIPSAVTSVTDSIGSVSGGTLSLGSGTLSFQNADTTGSIKATLTSNVTGGATPIFQGGAAATQTVILDTAGHTLDLGTAAESLSATGANAIAWSLQSSSGNGTFKAASFDLHGAAGGATVGPNLTLQATGAGGTTNTLSNTVGTIDPTSTFAYAGTATTSNFAKLVSTRTIGNLAVTSGALQLSGPITTGATSTATVAANGTLDLGGTTLTTASVTSSGLLGGSGTLATTAGVTSSGSFAPGESGTIGTVNLTGTGGLTLASTDNALFDIASLSSFDAVNLNGLPVSYGGMLTANFTGSPAIGDSYDIFNNGIGSSNFSSIVTNLPASETASFDPATGVLSISAVPEPTAFALLGVAAFGLLARRRRRQEV
jgi:hypothetical protein